MPHVRFEVVVLYSEQGIAISLSPYNKVVLDPPRTGAELLCKSLADSDAETIVYVSCNPVTLARDAKVPRELRSSVERVSVSRAVRAVYLYT